MSKLPPLPPSTLYDAGQCSSGHNNDAMREYGQACRAAALEEAARFTESGYFYHDAAPAKKFADMLAPKIRGLI